MVTRTQSNFSRGEISPEIQSSQSSEIFYKSLKTAKNVYISPRGNPTRRFGTRHIDQINTTTTADELAFRAFKIGIYSIYCILIDPLNYYIFYHGKILFTGTHPYSQTDLNDIRFFQDGNDLYILHEQYEPRILSRSASTSSNIMGLGSTPDTILSATTGAYRFIYPCRFGGTTLPTTIPQIASDQTYFIGFVSDTDFAIYATPEDADADENRFTIQNPGTSATYIIQNDWTLSTYAFKNQPTFDYNRDYYAATFAFNHTTNALTCSASVFTTDHVGGIFIFPVTSATGKADSLVGRIASYTSGTSVTLGGDWTTSTTTMNGEDCYLAEVVFSTNRGWPRTGGVFQSRLAFGGNTALPGVIWLSNTNENDNFDDSSADDTSAISLASSSNAGFVQHIVTSKTLTVFTNSGVFSTLINSSAALTPTNRKFDEESGDGAEDIQPLQMDNQIFYVAQGGQSVNSILFDININSYSFNNASVLSDHLIDDPTGSASMRNSIANDVDLALFSNRAGNMAIHSSLIEQGISGWSNAQTDGNFKRLTSRDGTVFAIIQRTNNAGTSLHVEEFRFDRLLDASQKVSLLTPVSTYSGLGYLEGKTVQVIADGYRYERVVSSGSITLDEPATQIEVGLGFTVEVEPLNFALPESDSVYFYKDKNVGRVYIDYYNSYEVKLNGETIPDLSFGNAVVTSAPTELTGVYRWAPMNGPQVDMNITISQDLPYGFTLRAIGYEVK